MKTIKKVAQSFAVVGKVLNSKSTSTQDTYSCDYINNNIGIVERGGDVNTTYIKFADGTMICTKRVAFSGINFDKAWGSLYEVTNLDLGNFPIEFIENPIINCSIIQSYGAFIQRIFGRSTTSLGKIDLARPVQGTELNIIVECIAIGRWK